MAGEIQLNSTTMATESSGSITAELDTIRPNTTDGSLTLQGDSSNAGVTGLTIDSSGVVSVNTGYVTLNNNKVGGIQVTIADDAYAEITPPRVGAHFMAITEGGDEAYPFSGCYGFVYADFGESPALVQVSVGGDVQTSTSGPPTGTTGNDAYLTLFVGGTSGKIYLENRLGFTGVFQITFL